MMDPPNRGAYVRARTAVRNGLVGEGLSEHAAELWVAGWEAQSIGLIHPGNPDYWKQGRQWIGRERNAGHRPPGAFRPDDK